MIGSKKKKKSNILNPIGFQRVEHKSQISLYYLSQLEAFLANRKFPLQSNFRTVCLFKTKRQRLPIQITTTLSPFPINNDSRQTVCLLECCYIYPCPTFALCKIYFCEKCIKLTWKDVNLECKVTDRIRRLKFFIVNM